MLQVTFRPHSNNELFKLESLGLLGCSLMVYGTHLRPRGRCLPVTRELALILQQSLTTTDNRILFGSVLSKRGVLFF